MTPEAFVQRVTASIEDIALRFAGEPDDKVEALLSELQERWTERFCELWPGADPETMEAGALCIAEAVRKRRREIERQ